MRLTVPKSLDPILLIGIVMLGPITNAGLLVPRMVRLGYNDDREAYQ